MYVINTRLPTVMMEVMKLLQMAALQQRSFALLGTRRTVPVFRQKVTLEDAIGSHTCSLEALAGV